MANEPWHVFGNNTGLEVGLFSVTGCAALVSIIFTALLAYRHLKHWVDPVGQKAIVRILFMVPVYSVVSFLAVLVGDYALYFTLVRDCYEAYVLYQFFCLMVHYVAEEAPNFHNIGEETETGQLLAHFGETAFPFPLCMMTYQPGNRVFLHIKRCSLQYVFIKPTLSAVAILLHLIGLYHPGSFDTSYGYFWVAILLNVSAALAMYFIFMFYELIKKVVYTHRLLHKLIAIKILVFFVFWQGFLTGLLYYFGVIPAFFGWDTVRSAETVQNVLICLEMTGLSLYNFYAFNYDVYRTASGENTLDVAMTNIQTVLNHKDMLEDTADAFHPDRLKHAIEKRL